MNPLQNEMKYLLRRSTCYYLMLYDLLKQSGICCIQNIRLQYIVLWMFTFVRESSCNLDTNRLFMTQTRLTELPDRSNCYQIKCWIQSLTTPQCVQAHIVIVGNVSKATPTVSHKFPPTTAPDPQSSLSGIHDGATENNSNIKQLSLLIAPL